MSGPGLPDWPSPISHAVVVDRICYVSGQLALNEHGVHVAGRIEEEAECALSNLFAVLRAAEFAPEDLVFIDVALIDLSDMAGLNSVWVALFPEGRRPARTVQQVVALPFGGRVKVMGVAIKALSLGR